MSTTTAQPSSSSSTSTSTSITLTNETTSVYQDLVNFLQSPNRPDVRLEAAKAILQSIPNKADARQLVQHGIVRPLLKVISAIDNDYDNDDDDGDDRATSSTNQSTINAAASDCALQSLLYLTSSTQELANAVVQDLLDAKAVPRLVELILSTTITAGNNKINNSNNKRRINWAMAILANLTRTEEGALELVGKTLPEEAVYEKAPSDDGASSSVQVKPTLELLLDRFLNPTLVDTSLEATRAYGTTTTTTNDNDPHHEWDALYEYDPYQHFAAVLMNATQVPAGRQFVMRIPRLPKSKAAGEVPVPNTSPDPTDPKETSSTTASSLTHSPPSVLQRLLVELQHSHNPLRRRGLSGLVRNVCLDKDATWWLIHVAKVLTPILLPLAGPEALEWNEKKGMDPDLWMKGPDQIRDVDVYTRQHCVEAILLLCAGGRTARRALKRARTDVVLKYCDMVEESETVSERIAECFQWLSRDDNDNVTGTGQSGGDGGSKDNDDEGKITKEGDDRSGEDSESDDDDSHDKQHGNNTHRWLEAAPATRVTMGGNNEEGDDDDYDTVD